MTWKMKFRPTKFASVTPGCSLPAIYFSTTASAWVPALQPQLVQAESTQMHNTDHTDA